jgi:hypothetical protein
MYAWAYDNVQVEDRDDLRQIAKAGADALESVHGTKYKVGTVPEVLGYPGKILI